MTKSGEKSNYIERLPSHALEVSSVSSKVVTLDQGLTLQKVTTALNSNKITKHLPLKYLYPPRKQCQKSAHLTNTLVVTLIVTLMETFCYSQTLEIVEKMLPLVKLNTL